MVTVATSMAGRGSDIALHEKALLAGGMHVLLCQLNSSGRVDRQFLGRAGRQGQPGSAEHWLAGDFDLLGKLPKTVHRLWLSHRPTSAHSLSLYLHLLQRVRTYTQMKQRVSLLRSAEAEEREFAFSRNQVL